MGTLRGVLRAHGQHTAVVLQQLTGLDQCINRFPSPSRAVLGGHRTECSLDDFQRFVASDFLERITVGADLHVHRQCQEGLLLQWRQRR